MGLACGEGGMAHRRWSAIPRYGAPGCHSCAIVRAANVGLACGQAGRGAKRGLVPGAKLMGDESGARRAFAVMRPPSVPSREEADVTGHRRPRACLAALATLGAVSLGLWGGGTPDLTAQSAKSGRLTTAAAKSDDARAPASASRGQGIAVIVNDEPITGYEIEQRARFLGLSANVGQQAKEHFQQLVKSDNTEARLRALQQEVIQSNPGKSREQLVAIFQERQKEFGMALQKQALESARASLLPKFRKDAKEELIEERLKIQAARKLGIVVSDEDVKTILKDIAGRNKMSLEQFTQHLKSTGVDIATMGERFRAQKAWRDMIGRRYGAQVSVSQRDVDKVLSEAATEAGEDTVELQVQKVAFALPGKIDQPALTKRYAEAEALRRRLSGCKGMADLAKSVPDTRFDDMKYIKPGAIAEPMRSMLLSAKDGDVLPPVTTSAGVEIYAVCGRRGMAGNEERRSQAMAQLQMKELDIFAKRHLRNVRQEANIEYK
jgi:peptidyl-prolyl cis-trans isomerase SurA